MDGSRIYALVTSIFASSPTPPVLPDGIRISSFNTHTITLLADNLAVFVNKGWEFLADLTVTESWCVILGYTLQLYFDFSGYCDIATGFARCMGIRLPRNFDSPYRALSFNDFWKRWHITLTTFLRECVYFPLLLIETYLSAVNS